MSAADEQGPVTDAEAAVLFVGLAPCKALVLAVSGGPDSTALLVLAARWRAALATGPSLLAVTVDHGLRPQARSEARAVARLAATLGIAHRTSRWTGPKPATGLQEAARAARYRLLAAAARQVRARHILTAHTLDDQAETVLFRLARGSGLSGLAAMAPISPLPALCEDKLLLARPFLDVPKARLIATLEAAGISFAEDPTNRDPCFARPRLREAMPALAAEGLSPARLALLAKRARRASDAIEAAVDSLAAVLVPSAAATAGRDAPDPVKLDAAEWARAPAETRLRLLGRLIERTGHEGPVELGKLEACEQALMAHHHARLAGRFRRTLAGAVITLAGARLSVAPAPPRRSAKRPRKGQSAPRSWVAGGTARVHQAPGK